MIILSDALIASPPDGEPTNAPLIGADNIVTASNIAATSEDADHPATELANPAADLYWQATSTDPQYLTVITGTGADLDSFCIDGHNFGTAGIAVSAEGDTGSGFAELVAPQIPPDDRPIMMRWSKGAFSSVRLLLDTGSAPASAAVLHLGLLLAVPRLIGVGHTPITYARDISIAGNQSQNGKFLGSVDLGRVNRTAIEFKNLDPAWLRANLDPVLAARSPFFFAWRPATYPLEVGYLSIVGNPKPVNQRSNGMMALTLQVEGEG